MLTPRDVAIEERRSMGEMAEGYESAADGIMGNVASAFVAALATTYLGPDGATFASTVTGPVIKEVSAACRAGVSIGLVGKPECSAGRRTGEVFPWKI